PPRAPGHAARGAARGGLDAQCAGQPAVLAGLGGGRLAEYPEDDLVGAGEAVPVQRCRDVVGRAVADDRVDEPVRAGSGQVLVPESEPPELVDLMGEL